MPYRATMSLEFWRDMGRLPPAVLPRAVRTVARMAENPWSPENRPERVQQAERGVHSCRVDEAYRVIWKHIQPDDIVFCLVDRHDEAYRRAARRTFTLRDGVIAVSDIVEEGARPAPASGGLLGALTGRRPRPGALFARYSERDLRDLGAPAELLPDLRATDDLNDLQALEDRLPGDVFDALLARAIGEVERPTVPDSRLAASLAAHGGGQDLYRFVDGEEFRRALEGSLEEWMLFLAPPQRSLVTRRYAGPARVKGVAGSGKTVVAIHRARRLAREAGASGGKVLFLTYGSRLPEVVRHLLGRLCGEGSPEGATELAAVECCTVHSWCARFLRERGMTPRVEVQECAAALEQALAHARPLHPGLALWSRPASFFKDEIATAIKGRCVRTLDDYLALDRGGRGTPLREPERRAVFAVYQAYQVGLHERGLCDWDDFILEALWRLGERPPDAPYRAAVVDEIQDLTEAVMRLVRALVPPGPDDLFLVGDGVQRIYPGGYALGRLGIDVVGRGTLLTRNYRNTREILRAAHLMMAGQPVDDMEAGAERPPEPEWSVRRGELPVLRRFAAPQDEVDWVGAEMERLKAAHGYRDADFAVLYRYRDPYLNLIQARLGPHRRLAELGRDAAAYFGPDTKHSTFDSAKGLEFKVVFVVGVTDGAFVPRDDWSLQGDELDDYLARERRRLYVAMTRARDRLYLTCSRGQPSRFLADAPPDCLRRE